MTTQPNAKPITSLPKPGTVVNIGTVSYVVRSRTVRGPASNPDVVLASITLDALGRWEDIR